MRRPLEQHAPTDNIVYVWCIYVDNRVALYDSKKKN